MVHLKYTYKNGKRFGPYFYENKRVNGKVVTTYLGKESVGELKKSRLLYLLPAFLLLFFGLFLLYQEISLTGKVVLDISDISPTNESIVGQAKILLKYGELMPAGSIVEINLNSQEKEIALSSLVSIERESGNFFIENAGLQGSGEGFGVKGTKKIYPTIYFRLKIERQEKAKKPTYTISETEQPEEGAEGQATETPAAPSQEQEAPAENKEKAYKITGQAIETRFVDGQANALENFTYELSENEQASIEEESVKAGNESLPESAIGLTIENNKVIIYTNYCFEEPGFGQEYINESTFMIEVNVSEFGLAPEEGMLSLRIIYENITIASSEKSITLEQPATKPENISEELPEGNITQFLRNVTIETLRSQIRAGQPVRWVKKVKLAELGNISIELPGLAENISVKKIKNQEKVDASFEIRTLTGRVIASKEAGLVKWLESRVNRVLMITGFSIKEKENETILVVLSDNSKEYEIEYYTPAPELNQTDISQGKRVIVSAPDELNYTNVITFATLDNEVRINDPEQGIKVYWYNYEFEKESVLGLNITGNITSNLTINETNITFEQNLSAENESINETINETLPEETSKSPQFGITALAVEGNESLNENSALNLSQAQIARDGSGIEGIDYVLQEVASQSYDLDNDGYIDYVEWTTSHLSRQTFKAILANYTQAGIKILWEYNWSGSGRWSDIAYAVAVDSNDSIIIAGFGTNLTASGGSSGMDYHIKKLNSNGSELWQKNWSSAGNNGDAIRGVDVDSQDNIIVAGWAFNLTANSENYDWHIKKLNSSGTELWQYNWSSGGKENDDGAYTVAVDSNDSIIVVGYGWNLTGSSGYANSSYDWHIKKLNSSGTELWEYNWSGPKDLWDEAYEVTVDSDDNIIVAGYGTNLTAQGDVAWHIKKLNSSGTELWEYNWSSWDAEKTGAVAYDVAADSDDNIIVVGYGFNLTGKDAGYYDWHVKKFNSGGDELWNYSWSGVISYDKPYSVDTDSKDNILVVGEGLGLVSSSTAYDWHIAKLNSSGSEVWQYNWSSGSTSTYSDTARGIAIDSWDNFIVVGYGTNLTGRVTGKDSSADWHIKKFGTFYAPEEFSPWLGGHNFDTSQLIGEWRFEWGNATWVYDEKGENNGTVVGASHTQEGRVGMGYEFDGVDDVINISDKASLDIGTEDFTISLWYKQDDVTANSPLLSKRPIGSGGGVNGYIIYILNNDVPYLQIDNDDGDYATVTSSTDVVDDKWHHLVFVADRDDLGYIYIDGVQNKNNSIATTSNSLANTQDFWIGRGCGSINCEFYLNGTIDEVLIFNRSLTADEVKNLYNYSAGQRTHNLADLGCSANETSNIYGTSVKTIFNWRVNNVSETVLNMPFEDGNINTTWTKDYSGYRNNGTVNGGAVWNATGGHDGFGAYEFDGSNDYIKTPQITLADNTAYAIAYWFNDKHSTAADNNMPLGDRDLTTSYVHHVGEATLYIRFYAAGGAVDTNINKDIRNQWHHFVISVNGSDSNNVKTYFDGQLNETNTLANTLFYFDTIGVGHSTATYTWNGSIDDVLIFNRSLTADEVKDLYYSGSQNLRAERSWINDVVTCEAWPADSSADGSQVSTVVGGVIEPREIKVNFTSPTPDNNTITQSVSNEINMSIETSALKEFGWGWNNTNYTFYNESLMLMYNFENLSTLGENATRVTDASKYSNNGTVYNGARWTSDGKYGGGYIFDGTNDYIEAPDSNSLDLVSRGTISFWVNKNAQATNYPMYITKGTNNYQIREYLSTGRISISWGADGDTLVSDKVVPPNTWAYITTTYNGSLLSLYIDGVLNKTVATGSGVANAVNLMVGRRSDGYYFNGSIDEVRIWNRSLSVDEIQQQYMANLRKYDVDKWAFFINETVDEPLGSATYYYSGWAQDEVLNSNSTETRQITIQSVNPGINFTSPTPDNNTITQNLSNEINISVTNASDLNTFIWSWNNTNYTIYDNSLLFMMNLDNRSELGENDTRFVDLSKNSHVGTAGGTPTIVEGKYGNAIDCNADTDYVTVPDNAMFTLSKNYSIEAWINPDDIANDYKGIAGTYTTVGFMLALDNTADNKLGFWAGSWAWSTYPIREDGSWKHVVYTRNNTLGTFYVDGENVSNVAATAGTDGGELHICGGGTGWASYRFDGKLDEVRIYNRTLSADEVEQHYYSNLQKYDTDKWNFYINEEVDEPLGNATYNYYGYVKDNSGNPNQTETRQITIQSVNPGIEFISPTPEDGTITPNSSAEIKIDITNANDLDTFIWNWNATNYTIYNDSLILMYNFDYVREDVEDWPMFRKNLEHTGETDATNIRDISNFVASYTAGDDVESSPAVADGYVYVGSYDNKLYQLNASNVSKLVASYTTGGDVYSSPAVADGYVYVGSLDDKVYQLNASNVSKLVASYTTGGDVYSSPAISGGYVYIGSADGKVYQLNATNVSQMIASYTTGGGVSSSSLAVSEGYVYIGSYDKAVYQLNATDISQMIANYTTGGEIFSSPAVGGGYVYTGSWDNKLYQLNATNVSKLVASYTTGGDVYSSPAVADGYVYVGSLDDKVYQLNASNVSKLVASYTTGGDISSSPAVAGGYVYVGGVDNKTYQLNATNVSKLVASYTTGNSIYWSSPAVGGKYLYVGSADNNLYQLGYFRGTESVLGDNDTYVVDISKYGNNGTVSGATWTSSGKYEGAYEFDGVNDNINAGNSGTFSVGLKVTYSAWIYPIEAQAGYILSKWVNGAEDKTLDFSATQKAQFFLWNCMGGSALASASNVSLNNWTHIAGTYNGSEAIIYLNGVRDANKSAASCDPADSTGNMYIGYNPSRAQGPFNGSIDEVRIYNRTLSADEVKQLYYSNLRKYDTDKWEFYTNQTLVANKTQTYYGFVKDTKGNPNQTETRTIGDLVCGVNVSNDLVMWKDLNCSGTALNVKANNIMIDCTGHTITGNETGYGLSVDNFDGITIKNCKIFNFSIGVNLAQSSNSNITNNTISDNDYTNDLGIYVSGTNNNFIGNNVSNNYDGIYINAGSSNTLTDNILNNNSQRGIWLYSNSNSNTIKNNTINSNSLYGISIESSSSNLIYNNFLNNTVNAYNPSGTNYWNTTKTAGTNIIGGSWTGGNYWGGANGYSGEDTTRPREGIGETLVPWNSTNNITTGGDYLPLMYIVNEPPVVATVLLNSSQGENRTGEDLMCWANATDPLDGDRLDYSGFWYKNGIRLWGEDWNKTIGGNDQDNGYGVAVDSGNNVVVTGFTGSFGAGNSDVWTIKYNSFGSQIWSKTIGGISSDAGYGVAVDSEDNVVVTGYTASFGTGNQEVWTIKYNSSGSQIWNKTIGGSSNDNGYGVAVDSEDNVVVTGFTGSFGAGNSDVWTIKYNSSGSLLWNKTIGGGNEDYGEGIAVDSQDNIIVTGHSNYSGVSYDVWTIKYNSSGSLLWNKTIGGSGSDYGHGVAVDSQDNIIVTGFTYSFGAGNSDVWTIKYNSSGSQIWNKTIGGSSSDYGYGVAVDSGNNVVVTGETSSFGAGNQDVWTIKYNSSGSQIWNKTIGGSSSDYGYGVAVDSGNNVVVTGFTGSFGAVLNDVWTIKYYNKYNFTLENQTAGVLVNVSTLDDSETNFGDIWSCEVQAYDGKAYSGYNMSNNLTIKTFPDVTFISPINDTYYTTQQILVNITNSSDAVYVWWNNETANLTYTEPVYINLSEGSHTFYAWANNSQGNVTETSVTFIVDTIPPFIAIISPTNGTYYMTKQILINITNNSDTKTIWWFNGTANLTYTEPVYYNFSEGWHTIYAWGNDSAGNLIMRSVTFMIDVTSPVINFTYPTPANDSITNTIFVNVTSSDLNEGHYTFLDWNKSLVGWWRMNKESGENDTLVKDWSTYSNNGTTTTATFNASGGKFGGAFEFDGNDYISFVNSSSLALTNMSHSVNFWVKHTGNFPSGYGTIIGKQDLSGNQKFYILMTSDGSLWRWDSFDSNYNIPANEWHHVIYTFDAINDTNGTEKFYVDGVLKNTRTGTMPASRPDKNIQIGYPKDGHYFNGTIDDVLIFNRALSEQEIKALYNATTNQYSRNFTSEPEGSYDYQAYAVDLAGNTNNTEERRVTLDKTASQIKFVEPTPANGTIRNIDSEINISIVEEKLKEFVFSWNNTNTTFYSDNLVLMMNLDNRSELEENDTYVVDVSKYSNNGTAYNNVTFNATGRYGGAYEFDGVDDYIDVPSQVVSNDNYSISLWVKPNTLALQYMIARGDGLAGQYDSIGIYTSGAWKWLLWNGITDLYGSPVTAGVWKHLVFVRNDINVKLYADGILDINGTMAETYNSGNFTIGVRTDKAWYFNGIIDEVRIWNRSLTASEVEQVYKSNLYKYDSDDWVFYSNLSLPHGQYNYYGFVKDTAGNTNSTETRTLYVDRRAPSINFTSPTPTNNTLQNSRTLQINLSLTDNNEFYSVNNLTTFVDFNKTLVGWWRFNSDTLANDSSTYGNNGTVTGATWNATGKFGGAYEFDGVNDYIDASSLDAYPNGKSAITLSAWIKTGYDTTGVSNAKAIAGWWYNRNNILKYGGSGRTNKIVFSVANSTSPEVAAISPLAYNDNQWHHVIGAYDSTAGANNVKLYIDGVNVISNTMAGAPASTDQFDIGTIADDAGGTWNFNGTIDEVSIFSRALSSDEILNLYNSSKLLHNITTSSDGTFTYKAYSQDGMGNVNNTEMREIRIDTVAPTVSFISPTNGTAYSTQQILINITNSSDSANTWWFNGTVNLTYTEAVYYNFSEGWHTIYAYANDSAGNVVSTSVTFLIDITLPSIYFVSPTPANNTVTNTVFVNVTSTDTNQHYTFLDWNKSLVGWWRMNKESGENDTFVKDYSSYTNNGTVTGATWNASGKFGGGFGFDGVNDGIGINYDSIKNTINSTTFTMSAWIKTNNANAADQQFIVGHAKEYLSGNKVAGLWVASGIAVFSTKNASGDAYGGKYTTGTTALKNNTWYHVAGIYNGTLQSLYVNGVLEGSTAQIGTLFVTAYFYFPSIGSGAEWSPNVYDFFNGTIDDVLIFNRALSEQEIKALYNATINQYSRNFTSEPEGSYDYQAYAVDLAGNTNNTEERRVTLDKTASQIKFVEPTPANGTIRNIDSEINISIVEEKLKEFVFSWNNTNTTFYSDNLVLMMNLDNRSELEENDTYVVDVSKYSNNGTAYNNVTFNATGKFGGAYEFDGKDDYVAVGDVGDGVSNLTISVWAKPAKAHEGYFVGKDDTGASRSFVFGTYTSNEMIVYFQTATGYDYSISGSEDYSVGVWSHFVATYSDGTTKVYVNGKESTLSWTTNTASGAISNNTLSTDIGRRASGTQYFNGTIDEVRIYNRSLSADEISQLYKSNLYKHNATQWYFYSNQSNLSHGKYDYYGWVKDTAGNTNSTETRTLYVDRRAPSINFTSPTPENNTLQNSRTLQINLSLTDNSEFYSVNNLTTFIDFNKTLVGWWRFNSDTLANDSSTYGNNGTVSGATWNATGKFGGVYEFDGVNDQIIYGTTSTLDKIGDYAVSFWINPKNSFGEIINKRGFETGAGWWQISYDNNTQAIGLGFSLVNASGGVGGCGDLYGGGMAHFIDSVKLNEWTHALIVFDHNATGSYCKGYRNGVFNYSWGPDAKCGCNQTQRILRIGSTYFGTSYFNGTIDEVSIFSRALSSDEILNLYNSSKLNHNITASSDGTFTYKAYSQDPMGNVNNTEMREIRIDATYPRINFTSPTPANGSTQTADAIYVNYTTSDDNNITSFINFDKTLVGWWRMNKETGENYTFVKDYSTYANNGTTTTATWTSAGKFGGGFEFDGVDDYIIVPYNANTQLNTSKQITVSAWIKFHPAFFGIGGNSILTLSNDFECGMGAWGYGNANFLCIWATIGSKVNYTFINANSGGFNTTQWQHFAFTFTNNSQVLYRNGKAVATTSHSADILSPACGSGCSNYIGNEIYNARDFNGTIDDVLIFNRSLSSEEIVALYNSTQTYHNFTGLGEGDHTMKAYVQDLAGNVNNTEERVVKIQFNVAPNTPTVGINSTDGTNRSNQDLNCFATITDNDANKMNVSVKWYRDDVLNLSLDYNNSYNNGTLFNSVLGKGNTTKGENWSCSMRLFDGLEYSEWGTSGNLTILNSLPVVTLLLPPDHNVTTDRMPAFTWDGVDDDNDALTFEFNISLVPASLCSEEDRYVQGLSGESYALPDDLNCFADDGDYYIWSARANDGEVWGSWATYFRINITSLVSINLTTDLIEFGKMVPPTSNDTTDNSPMPFVIENDGNVKVNVTLGASSLWQSIANPNSYYKFKIDNKTNELNSFNWLASLTSWTNMPLTASAILGLVELKYKDQNDTAEIDIYVEVPPNEQPGTRNSTATFTASRGE